MRTPANTTASVTVAPASTVTLGPEDAPAYHSVHPAPGAEEAVFHHGAGMHASGWTLWSAGENRPSWHAENPEIAFEKVAMRREVRVWAAHILPVPRHAVLVDRTPLDQPGEEMVAEIAETCLVGVGPFRQLGVELLEQGDEHGRVVDEDLGSDDAGRGSVRLVVDIGDATEAVASIVAWWAASSRATTVVTTVHSAFFSSWRAIASS